jgi:hypothetical protein
MKSLRGVSASVLAAVVCAAPAVRAEDAPRDYDAPDPARGPVQFLHAGANVLTTAWVIWQFAWIHSERVFYATGPQIIDGFHYGYHWEDDGLTADQFGHPYSGGLYFEGARSVGLSFWESALYALGGSAFWEAFAERDGPPGAGPHYFGLNDSIVTPLGGVATGEIMHRMSSLALDDSRRGGSRFFHEFVGMAASPVRGVNRVLTGEAFREGAPPVAKPARISFHGGVDRVVFVDVEAERSFLPSALLAVDVEYGDLAPREGENTIPAYDFFDLYFGGILSPETLSGIQLSTLGLLHGWSLDIGAQDDPDRRTNNVLGFVQSAEFQSAEVVRYSTFGLGFGDFLVARYGPRRRLRLNADVEWTVLGAVASPFTPYANIESDRNYNYTMGPSLGIGLRSDLGRYGQLGLNAREHLTRVVDGTDGNEHVGYARAWYEFDLIDGRLGVGIAPTLVNRAGLYTGGQRFIGVQLTNQLYLTVHP